MNYYVCESTKGHKVVESPVKVHPDLGPTKMRILRDGFATREQATAYAIYMQRKELIGSSAIPYTWFLKWVGTYSKREKMIRVARLVWANGKPGGRSAGGTEGGYTAKLSLALLPQLFGFNRECLGEWSLTLLGIRIHYQRSYGGWTT